jgi:peptidoglycan hydrolase CwlO-like protein
LFVEQEVVRVGISVDEAINRGTPLEYTEKQKQELLTMLETELVNVRADVRKWDSEIAKTDADIQDANKELAKTYRDLAVIYEKLAELC